MIAIWCFIWLFSRWHNSALKARKLHNPDQSLPDVVKFLEPYFSDEIPLIPPLRLAVQTAFSSYMPVWKMQQ